MFIDAVRDFGEPFLRRQAFGRAKLRCAEFLSQACAFPRIATRPQCSAIDPRRQAQAIAMFDILILGRASADVKGENCTDLCGDGVHRALAKSGRRERLGVQAPTTRTRLSGAVDGSARLLWSSTAVSRQGAAQHVFAKVGWRKKRNSIAENWTNEARFALRFRSNDRVLRHRGDLSQ